MAKVIQIDGRVGKRARAKLRRQPDPTQKIVKDLILWVREYRARLKAS